MYLSLVVPLVVTNFLLSIHGLLIGTKVTYLSKDHDMCADGGTCIPPQADKGFTPAQIAIWVYANEKDTSNAYNEIMFQISEGKWAGTPTPAPVGIYSVAFMHGRCLMIGATGCHTESCGAPWNAA